MGTQSTQQMKTTTQKISFVYLLAVPFAASALAFIIGHVNLKFYIPFWLLNASLMLVATRQLIGTDDNPFYRTAWYFIIPWVLISIFGGMGPPPETAAAWAALATEQVIRYTVLIISGLLTVIGFFRLDTFFAGTKGHIFARAGTIMVGIACPLFVLNMAYWGYFLTDIFCTYSAPGAPVKPDWLKTAADIFIIIRMTEVALIYLCTPAFAIALCINKKLSKASSTIYVVCGFLGAMLNLLPITVTGPLAIANYLSYIPAFTLLMPYLIAINLLRKK